MMSCMPKRVDKSPDKMRILGERLTAFSYISGGLGGLDISTLFERTASLMYRPICYHDFLDFMHLSAAIPGGVTPGTYGGIARDLLTFVANFWPRTGALDRFCTTAARYTGKDPRGFVTSPPS